MIPIKNPRYALIQGYPILIFESKRRRISLLTDQQKPALTAAGLIYLGGRFSEELPAIAFQVPGEPDKIIRLTGFTDDPGVSRLFRQFLRDVAFYGHDFPVGPVSVSDRVFDYWADENGGQVDLVGRLL